jgi:hypothetical protein
VATVLRDKVRQGHKDQICRTGVVIEKQHNMNSEVYTIPRDRVHPEPESEITSSSYGGSSSNASCVCEWPFYDAYVFYLMA